MGLPNTVDHRKVLARRGGECLARMPKGSCVAVEVGVFRGALAACVLREHSDIIWHMVDPWERQPDDGSYRKSDDAVSRLTQDEMDDIYLDAVNRVKTYKDRAVIWRHHSDVAARMWVEQGRPKPDMIFIDGDHSEEGVFRDLDAWASLVSPTGWIGGHDWRTDGKVGWNLQEKVPKWFKSRIGFMPPVETGRDKTWWVKSKDYLSALDKAETHE